MSDDDLRVLVADDHEAFRTGLRALLETVDGVSVVAVADGGEEAVRLADREQPDVVLMDLDMPGVGGIAATRRIVATSPHIAVLVVSMLDDDDSIFEAMRAGARGYVLKGADRREIVRAVRSVASGEAIFGPSIARRLVAWFSRSHPDFAASAFPELTEREVEILDLIARGIPNAEIANRLVVSPKTVRNHVSNIFSKLQVRDRAEAIVRAREAGLGTRDRTGPATGRPAGSRDPA